MGVDGMRLTLFRISSAEGDQFENLARNTRPAQQLPSISDVKFPRRMFLPRPISGRGRVPISATATSATMAFTSRVMPRLSWRSTAEDRSRSPTHGPDAGHPPTTANGHFLRNHDELTLEMYRRGTDYSTVRNARDNRARINSDPPPFAPLLNNDRRRSSS